MDGIINSCIGFNSVNPSDFVRHHRHWIEAVTLVTGLVAVGMADPTAQSWIDLCIYKAAGFSWCPGCGLGHAMGFLARGEWASAIESHVFSPVIAAFMIQRIGSSLREGIDLRTLRNRSI